MVKKPYGNEEVWVRFILQMGQVFQFSTLPHGDNSYQELGLNINPDDLLTLDINNYSIYFIKLYRKRRKISNNNN